MYLAHINHEDKREQTLNNHVWNVATLCREYGKPLGLPATAELCGLLHDMGKAKEEFQTYMLENSISQRGKINHSSAGAKYIHEKYSNTKNPYELLTAQLISLVICSHHSGLIDCINPNGIDKYLPRVNPESETIAYQESKQGFQTNCADETEIENLFRQSVTEIQTLASTILTKYKKDSSFYFGLVARYLLSCVIDADRYDTYCFHVNQETQDTDYCLETTWETLSETLEKHLLEFTEKTDIDKYRSEISLSCKEFAQEKPGIYRLYVPTGGGKTLSSLRFAINHAKANNKSRIIYAIPYTAIIDQNAQVIRNALQNEDLILEHHSNIIPDEEETDETQTIRRLLTERWDSPIILTTTVQLLNTLFLGKTQSVRRMHNLSNSIIIFDEVQTIPKKCLSLFNSAINFLAEICGATIILCTATQPALETLDNPIRLSQPFDIIENYDELFANCKRTEIIDHCIDKEYTTDDLANFVFERHQHHKKILIILNTKKAAENLFRKIQEKHISDASLYYLSTNLCPRHRMDILDSIIKQLKTDDNIICVTTQLIEAGVDISFDCVIRSLAGLDSIAQAAGRCNRHGKSETGNVYIIKNRDENLHRLLDIKLGQIATERVCRDMRDNPEKYGNDLLSPEAIRAYYSYYYAEAIKGEMDYRLEKGLANIPEDDTLYNLLSGNTTSLNHFTAKGHTITRNLNQAFATAGNLFHVIDENTITVLVPYQKGEEIIAKLEHLSTFNPTNSLKEYSLLLRQAQQYSISIFIDESKLESYGIYQIGESGVYRTTPFHYSEEYGYSPKADMEPMIL